MALSKITNRDWLRKALGTVCLSGAVFAATLGATAQAHAAGLEGVWLTTPDQKGQVAHVVSTPCGAGYCGTITRVYDAGGNPITLPTIGQQVFRDMTAKTTEDSSVFVGSVYVPTHKRDYSGQITVKDNQLILKACLGPVCQSQTWERVQN
jgi:uncharacterized protein (DUF2147 family)